MLALAEVVTTEGLSIGFLVATVVFFVGTLIFKTKFTLAETFAFFTVSFLAFLALLGAAFHVLG